MPTPPYICNVCNAMLESLEQLLSHIETHHPQKIRLTCESCGKVFSAPEYLTQHKKLHTRADRFKCEICGKFFARKDYLTDHTIMFSFRLKNSSYSFPPYIMCLSVPAHPY